MFACVHKQSGGSSAVSVCRLGEGSGDVCVSLEVG